MTRSPEAPETPEGPRQSVLGGVALIGFAGLALYAMRDLEGGTMRALGPGGLPRVAAILIAVLGAGIALKGWRAARPERMARIGARPLGIVLLAIFVFAVTIRPWDFGPFATPGLGLVGAGPLTVLVAGLAERRRDWLELGVLASALTAFCMVLFGDLLALPIPIMPVALLDWFPGWSQRAVLRLLAGLLVGTALALHFVGRGEKSA